MDLEHRPLADLDEIARPDVQRERLFRAEEDCVRAASCRPTELLEPPPARDSPNLFVVEPACDGGDVHEIADPGERAVRPRVRRDRERLVYGRERRDAVDTEHRGHRLIEHLLHGRVIEPPWPVGVIVDLHAQREPRPLEREQVRAYDVRGRIPHLHEPGLEQGRLRPSGVGHEHVQVDERAQRGVRVERGDVRALVQDDWPLTPATHQRHDLGGDKGCNAVHELGVLEVGRNRSSELSPAPCREQVQPIRSKRGDVRRAIDETLDRRPNTRPRVDSRLRVHSSAHARAYRHAGHPRKLDVSVGPASP